MAQSITRPANFITLSVGRGQLVTIPGAMTDVFVSNEQVADVQVKSQRQLYIFGKSGGETTVYASDAAGRILWSSNVRVGSNIESVDQMLQMAMPDAKVAVSTIGANAFLLTGTVASPEDVSEAQRLVQAFAGKDVTVISRLKTATPLQVNLQVRFAEVSRSLVKSLGMNLTTIDGTGGFRFGLGQGRNFYSLFNTDPLAPLGMGSEVTRQVVDPLTGVARTIKGSVINPQAGVTTLGGVGKLFGLNLLGALDAGEQIGLVTTLSNPNLTALSGETADFLAGGEYPIPIGQGLGQTSIEFKRFGVSLSYTPTVLSNGRISIRVRPEVSELSSQGAITVGGFQVPSLTVRRAETTVELGSGQSFMIAGLMSNNAQNTVKKLPGAGDLPILGSLFRSTNFQRGETELVIVVTPYLVNPVNGNDIKLPTDGYQSPDDISRIFFNQSQNGKSGATRPMPSAAPTPNPIAPRIGDLDGALSQPAPASVPASQQAAQPRKTKGGVADPGFSLD